MQMPIQPVRPGAHSPRSSSDPKGMSTVDLPRRYWGKADPSSGEPKWLLLAYHCLDVAAVGMEYLAHALAVRAANFLSVAREDNRKRRRADFSRRPDCPNASCELDCVTHNRDSMMTMITGHEVLPMEINAAEFKAKCLKLLDQVAATHEPLIITKRGKPVARLVPIEDDTEGSMFGYLRGTVTVLGDIVEVPHEPLAAETGEEDELYRPLLPSGKAGR